ncbi:hypothetical protein T09_1114 [Trichinella sp. T9]|nr:hypothetical protein T09_1114 [Trichinella sp. T9]
MHVLIIQCLVFTDCTVVEFRFKYYIWIYAHEILLSTTNMIQSRGALLTLSRVGSLWMSQTAV